MFELRGNRWVPLKDESDKAKRAPEPEKYTLLDSPLEGALVSAGDLAATVGRNARDVYARLRGDEAAQLSIEDERDEAAKFRQMMQEERPYSTLAGKVIPQLALGAVTGGGSLLANAGINAGLGAVQSESGDYATDAAIGGAFSLGGRRPAG